MDPRALEGAAMRDALLACLLPTAGAASSSSSSSSSSLASVSAVVAAGTGGGQLRVTASPAEAAGAGMQLLVVLPEAPQPRGGEGGAAGDDEPDADGAGLDWEAGLRPNAAVLPRRPSRLVRVVQEVGTVAEETAAAAPALRPVLLARRAPVPQLAGVRKRLKRAGGALS